MSKDKNTNCLLIITNFSFDSQLTAYLRQKHLISNYFNIISSYVHMIVIVLLAMAYFRQKYNYVHVVTISVETA